MQLRALEKKDIEFIVNSKASGFTDCYNENVLKSSINSGRFFGLIAEENGESVGYICYSVGIDDVDLESIFVLPSYRKKGIADILIKALTKKVKDKKILLEVRKSNEIAKNLYIKNGFSKISERKKYYFDGEDAEIYCKEIENR